MQVSESIESDKSLDVELDATQDPVNEYMNAIRVENIRITQNKANVNESIWRDYVSLSCLIHDLSINNSADDIIYQFHDAETVANRNRLTVDDLIKRQNADDSSVYEYYGYFVNEIKRILTIIYSGMSRRPSDKSHHLRHAVYCACVMVYVLYIPNYNNESLYHATKHYIDLYITDPDAIDISIYDILFRIVENRVDNTEYEDVNAIEGLGEATVFNFNNITHGKSANSKRKKIPYGKSADLQKAHATAKIKRLDRTIRRTKKARDEEIHKKRIQDSLEITPNQFYLFSGGNCKRMNNPAAFIALKCYYEWIHDFDGSRASTAVAKYGHSQFHSEDDIFDGVRDFWDAMVEQLSRTQMRGANIDEYDMGVWNSLATNRKNPNEGVYISSVVDQIVQYCGDIVSKFVYLPITIIKTDAEKMGEIANAIQTSDTHNVIPYKDRLYIAMKDNMANEIQQMPLFMQDMGISDPALMLYYYGNNITRTTLAQIEQDKTKEIKTPAKLMDPINSSAFDAININGKPYIRQNWIPYTAGASMDNPAVKTYVLLDKILKASTLYGLNVLFSLWTNNKKDTFIDYEYIVENNNSQITSIRFIYTVNNTRKSHIWKIQDTSVDNICAALIYRHKGEKAIPSIQTDDIKRIVLFSDSFAGTNKPMSMTIISFLKSCGDELQRLTCEYFNASISGDGNIMAILNEYVPAAHRPVISQEDLQYIQTPEIVFHTRDRILVAECLAKNTSVLSMLQSPHSAFSDLTTENIPTPSGVSLNSIQKTGMLANRQPSLSPDQLNRLILGAKETIVSILGLSNADFMRMDRQDNANDIEYLSAQYGKLLGLVTALEYYRNTKADEEKINEIIDLETKITILNSATTNDIANLTAIPETIAGVQNAINYAVGIYNKNSTSTYFEPEVLTSFIQGATNAYDSAATKIQKYIDIASHFKNASGNGEIIQKINVVEEQYAQYIRIINGKKTEFVQSTINKFNNELLSSAPRQSGRVRASSIQSDMIYDTDNVGLMQQKAEYDAQILEYTRRVNDATTTKKDKNTFRRLLTKAVSEQAKIANSLNKYVKKAVNATRRYTKEGIRAIVNRMGMGPRVGGRGGRYVRKKLRTNKRTMKKRSTGLLR